MTTLTNPGSRPFRGMTAGAIGVLAGMGLMAIAAVGFFAVSSDEALPSTSSTSSTEGTAATAAMTAEIATLTSELEALEAENSVYRATLAGIAEGSSQSVLVPAELDALLDTMIARVGAEALTLDEINAMIDEITGGA